MKKRDPLAEELAQIAAARASPSSEASQMLFVKVLDGKRSYAIAAVAELVASERLVALVPKLVAAFARLATAGGDPGCRARTAIATALLALDADEPELFLRGVTLVQREPVMGGNVDVAVDLRGVCALGLANLGDPRALPALVNLLVDPEWPARQSAARALGATGRLEAEAVLRHKALVGDAEPQVTGEVFASLLTMAPRESLAFVASFLERRSPPHGAIHAVRAGGETHGIACTACGQSATGQLETTTEVAALALGQSRRPDALPILIAWSERLSWAERRVALLALAMLRSTAAIDHLMSAIEEGPIDAAVHAVNALALHRHDEELVARVRKEVDKRGSKPLKEAFREAFAQS